ncbi:MAG: polyphosphate kinase 2 family protein [Thermoanaerobaculia bacterium]|nr:polyphosphate kinase 2 family protein [Thermoanaerobaculia bacterium]
MERYRVRPGAQVDLDRFDPDDTALFDGDKEAAQVEIDRLNDELEELQELLWARQKEKVLVVLQGMDTAGKDGVIRHVFDGVNPAGVRVASFKVPTAAELARDFLWRVHAQVPGSGEMVIFNRSHYEDVLVVRVHELVPKGVWQKRYTQIVDFERLLAETGTTILKFFLHISKSEQKQRLEERLADRSKRWKFNPGDLEERKRWTDYRQAYEDALEKTASADAPWYVVPADKKWYRNYVIASVLVGTLRGLGMKSPEVDFDPATIRIE